MNWVLVLLNSQSFFLYEVLPTAFFLAANTTHDNYLKHCPLFGLQQEIWQRPVISEREICLQKRTFPKFQTKRTFCDVFSEESDDFLFDISEEDSNNESDTSSVVYESELYEEVSDFLPPFILHNMAHPRFAFLGISGVNVDFDNETGVLECFQKLALKICGSCLLNK
jgi:hypothetical protein